jgi:hypothetical protein
LLANKHRRTAFSDDEDEHFLSFPPVWPGDCKGILFQLATHFGLQEWQSPVLSHKVAISGTPLKRGNPSDLVSPVFDKQVCYTENHPDGASVVFHLLNNYRVCPSHYALAHRHFGADAPSQCPHDGYYLRNWEFQGSDDGVDWTILSTHRKDRLLNKYRPYGITPVLPECSLFYSWFRLIATKPGNSEGTLALVMCCFELYGKLDQHDNNKNSELMKNEEKKKDAKEDATTTTEQQNPQSHVPTAQ